MNKKCVILTALWLYSSASYADQWAMDAKISQDIAYDDNVRMAQTPQGSVEYMLTPLLTFTHKTDNTLINASGSYGIQRYLSMSNINSSIQAHKIGSTYTTERSKWTIAASMDIAPSRNTAIIDSGNFSTNSQKMTLMVSPAVSYRLTERDTLQLSTNYAQTTYSSTEFSNNQSEMLSFDWQRHWTERYTSSVNAACSLFQSSNPALNTQLNTNTFSLNFSSTYLLDEKWKIAGTVGGRLTSSENGSVTGIIKNQNPGFLLDARIEYKGENLTSQLSATRSLVPSSTGQLQEQSQATLNLHYDITERLFAAFTTSYQLSTLLATTDSVKSTRENMIVQPSLNWQLSRDWSLSGNYRYRNQSVTGTQNQKADSNLFMISIHYNWQGLSLSR